MNEKSQTETFDSDKTFKHSDIRIFYCISENLVGSPSKAEYFARMGHIKSARLSESPTYPDDLKGK